MKKNKNYEKPFAELIRFDYRNQIVTASTPQCEEHWTQKKGPKHCNDRYYGFNN